MLEPVQQLLKRGDRDGAARTLRELLLESCTESFSKGELRHPLASPRSAALRAELRALAGALLPDVERARAVILALEAVDHAVRKKTVEDQALDALNFALQRLVPDIALVLDEALENARFRLGAAASDVESPFTGAVNGAFIRPEIKLIVNLAEHGLAAMEGGKLDRLQELSLARLDAEEGIPDILRIQDDLIVLVCPHCEKELTSPLSSFGDSIRCGCKEFFRVTRPSLERMAVYLKAQRDARRGISRCRICAGVIQTGKNNFMRAGFCSALCAKQAREVFREVVPAEGVPDGDQVRFQCACGASMTTAVPQAPEKMACLSCPLDVWVPLPTAPGKKAPKAILTCRCGRAIKSTALKCLYCGTPPPAP